MSWTNKKAATLWSNMVDVKKALWFLILFALMMCSACGASSSTTSTGTTLDLPNYWHMSVTLESNNATVHDDTFQGGIASPDAGNRFIALQVTATNIQQGNSTGPGSQIYVSDFSLYPINNNSQMPRAGDGRDNFPGNSIVSGNTGTATLYYQVPDQAGTYELDFQLHSIVTGTHAQCDIAVPGAS